MNNNKYDQTRPFSYQRKNLSKLIFQWIGWNAQIVHRVECNSVQGNYKNIVLLKHYKFWQWTIMPFGNKDLLMNHYQRISSTV